MKPPSTNEVRSVVWEDGEGNLPSYPIDKGIYINPHGYVNHVYTAILLYCSKVLECEIGPTTSPTCLAPLKQSR